VNRPRYSFVVPVYNEAEVLPALRERLVAVIDQLDGDAEVILVDDGSTDGSDATMRAYNEADPRFKVVELARNFGHQVALSAGLDVASGDAVVIMDADLQDPPEVVFQMIDRWREGYEIVYAVRQDRAVEPFLRRHAISLTYRILRRMSRVEIPVDAGDFRLVDRKALDAFRQLRESNRYVRGMFAWVGFRQIGVPYRRGARYAGASKYPLGRLAKLAVDGLVGFSDVPLRLALFLGFFCSIGSFLLGVGLLAVRALDLAAVNPRGWTSMIVVVTFLGGVQLMVLGAMGLYVARIHEEVKRRPLYVLRGLHGFDDTVGVRETTLSLPPDA
jgi:polyisoprenyl-phosphate glycosyltransferase